MVDPDSALSGKVDPPSFVDKGWSTIKKWWKSTFLRKQNLNWEMVDPDPTFSSENQIHHWEMMLDPYSTFPEKAYPPLRNGGSVFNFLWKSKSIIEKWWIWIWLCWEMGELDSTFNGELDTLLENGGSGSNSLKKSKSTFEKRWIRIWLCWEMVELDSTFSEEVDTLL
jgi:hypothetical protein